MEINRGAVYWIDLNPTKGSEIKKRRTCVVMGVDPINSARRTVVVIPLSSAGKEHPPLAIGLECMGKRVIAVVDQIRACDKSRFIEKCDELTEEEMVELEKGIRLVLGI
jgi:mRNA interferase MazF